MTQSFITILWAILFGFLGFAAGSWVFTQGYATCFAFVFTVMAGPFVIGLIVRHGALLSALSFNITALVAFEVRNYFWLRDFGADAPAEMRSVAWLIMFLFLLASSGATLAIVSNRLRLRPKARGFPPILPVTEKGVATEILRSEEDRAGESLLNHPLQQEAAPMSHANESSLSPLSQFATPLANLQGQLTEILDHLRDQAKIFPALAFTTHPSWPKARWSATTFQWHPQSQAPPIMGLVFDDAAAASEIFQNANHQFNHTDSSDQIRVSIIEGSPPGEKNRPAYTVHIGPDPKIIAEHLKSQLPQDPLSTSLLTSLLGQWNRHFPIPGSPPLLPRFKEEFAKHKEYLLAPVLRRPDGQLFAHPELGIIKRQIHFRNLADIKPDDIDAAALFLPQLIRPPGDADSIHK